MLETLSKALRDESILAALNQNGKLHACDDAKESLHNAASAVKLAPP